MSPLLAKVLEDISQLAPNEQMQVMEHLVDRVKQHVAAQEAAVPKRKLSEFMGVLPDLLEGQDAQAVVNQLRGEWDERAAFLEPVNED
ncbi:MAG: hypothetical protein HC790_11975 [Acaryochloridaceae cyanobacterium CSU_3_4]|nr:hypothetical protein [Acaryochloridaceae cyanobacterium CSU_3_4]